MSAADAVTGRGLRYPVGRGGGPTTQLMPTNHARLALTAVTLVVATITAGCGSVASNGAEPTGPARGQGSGAALGASSEPSHSEATGPGGSAPLAALASAAPSRSESSRVPSSPRAAGPAAAPTTPKALLSVNEQGAFPA